MTHEQVTDRDITTYREIRSHRDTASRRTSASRSEQERSEQARSEQARSEEALTGPRPVFVDRSGRRRRLVVLIGAGLAVLFTAGLGVLLVGLTGAAGLHVPGFPDQAAPGAHATPSRTPDPGQAGTRTEAGPVVPSPGGSATAATNATVSSPRRVPTQTPSHDPKPTKT